MSCSYAIERFFFTVFLHLVNERQWRSLKGLPRFYPILDRDTAVRCGISPVDAAEQILDAGARILQFRYKGFFSRDIFAEMERLAVLCLQSRALLVVNDRTDIARLLNAGLHLGQDDLTPQDARRIIGAEALVGYSTHNEQQLRAAASQPADYVAFGPIFSTASKQNPDPVVGVEELRRLRPLTARPLVAIGGLTRQNARSVLEAGADSIAVISDLFPEDGNIRLRVEEWLRLLTPDS
jgi:thiamine-phosphate pyrophosphorylase